MQLGGGVVECMLDCAASVARCLVVAVCVVYPLAGLAQTPDSRVQALFEQAGAALSNGHVETARKAYEGILQISGNDARALEELGQLHYSLGAYSQAESFLGRAVTQRPASFRGQLLLAATRLQQGKRAEALAPLESAHRLRTDNADAAKLLSIEYIALTRYRDAVEALQPLAATGPADDETLLLLIESYHRSGDAVNSLKLAEIAVGKLPKSPRLNCWLGFQLMRVSRFEESERSLRTALELDPEYEPSYFVMSDVLVHEGRYEDAIGFLQEAVRKRPNDSESRLLLGRALAGAERLDEALSALDSAVRLSPDDPFAHLELSRAHMRTGDTDKANLAAARYRELKRSETSNEADVADRLGFQAARD